MLEGWYHAAMILRSLRAALLLLAALPGGLAYGQVPAPGAPLDLQFPTRPQGQAPQPARPLPPGTATPGNPGTAPLPAPVQQRQLLPFEQGTSVRLVAMFSETGPQIRSGMLWRILTDPRETNAPPRLVQESSEAEPILRLPPGSYMVNASYGRASVTRRVQVSQMPIADNFVLNAGAIRLQGSIGDRPIRDPRITFSIVQGAGGTGATVIEEVRGNGRVVRVPVGEYHVVSRFGDANAVMAGDVRVEAGRVTDVTLFHRAAIITLKLVNEPGGEATADTAWSVLTPGGDTVKEFIGAFPTMILAAGEYSAVARNDGRIFSGRFTVEAGRDREVEILRRGGT